MVDDSLYVTHPTQEALEIEIEARLEIFLKQHTSDESSKTSNKLLPPPVVEKNVQ